LEKLGLNLGFLIVQILNFAIIMVVLIAWVYKPLMNMLQRRREKIEKVLKMPRWQQMHGQTLKKMPKS